MKKMGCLLIAVFVLSACKNERSEKNKVADDDYEAIYEQATTFFQPISSLDLDELDAEKVNGRGADVEEQAGGPWESSNEILSSRMKKLIIL